MPVLGGRLRQAERELERDMPREARAAFNRAKRKERARAFGALFDWKISVAEFPIAPRRGCRGRRCGRQAIRDRDAGLDHTEYYRVGRRPVAIVGRPYAPPSSAGSGTALSPRSSASVESVSSELDPVLGWYSNDPVDLPTARVVWMLR
jgi:hypothetical protein